MLKFLLTIPYTIFISPPLFFLKLTFSLLRLFLSPLTAFLRLTTLPLRSVSSHTWRAIKFAIEIGGGYRDIYIFLSTAALFGLLAGCVLFGVSYYALVALRLRSSPDSNINNDGKQQHLIATSKKSGGGGRTAASYRREREVRRKQEETAGQEALMKAWEGRNIELLGGQYPGGAQGLMGQTILEEEDSDF